MSSNRVARNLCRFFCPQLPPPFKFALRETADAASVGLCLGRTGIDWRGGHAPTSGVAVHLDELLRRGTTVSYTTWQRRYWPVLHLRVEGRGPALASQVAELRACGWYGQPTLAGYDLYVFFHDLIGRAELEELVEAATAHLAGLIVKTNVSWPQAQLVWGLAPDQLPLPSPHWPTGERSDFDAFFERPLDRITRSLQQVVASLTPGEPDAAVREWLHTGVKQPDSLVDELQPLVDVVAGHRDWGGSCDCNHYDFTRYIAAAVALHVRNRGRWWSSQHLMDHVGFADDYADMSRLDVCELWEARVMSVVWRLCPKVPGQTESDGRDGYRYTLAEILGQELHALGYWLPYDAMPSPW